MAATQTQERRNEPVRHLECYAIDSYDGEIDIYDADTGEYLTTWYQDLVNTSWEKHQLSSMHDAAPFQNAYD